MGNGLAYGKAIEEGSDGVGKEIEKSIQRENQGIHPEMSSIVQATDARVGVLTKASAFDSCSGHKPRPKRRGLLFMVYFVYILYSHQFERYYVGQTADIGDRLNRHNSGYEKATSPYVPWEMVWHTEKPSRPEAMELEKKLKNLSKERIREFIQKYPLWFRLLFAELIGTVFGVKCGSLKL